MDTRPVVVFGGTGHYGRRIVASLVRRGVPVRVVSRSVASARKIVGETPTIVEGDIVSAQTIARALEGARAFVCCVAAMSPALIRRRREIEHDAVLRVFEEAQRVGVARAVYLSGFDIREDLTRRLGVWPLAQLAFEVERALAASKLNWTVLGCPPSHEMLFAMRRGDRLVIPGGGPPSFPTVSPEDVGEVAALAALRDDLGGRRLRMAGPKPMSFPEAAATLGEVLGRRVTVFRPPLFAVNVVSGLAGLFNPFVRFIYWSLKLLNNFPQDLAAGSVEDHLLLRRTFDYQPVTFAEEARRRLAAAA